MKSAYETMGGKRQQNGKYLLPNLEVPENPNIGIWGERRRTYLREQQRALYTAMILGDSDCDSVQDQLYQAYASLTNANLLLTVFNMVHT